MKKVGCKIIDPNLSQQRKTFGTKHRSDLPKCEQHWPLGGWIMIPLKTLFTFLTLCKFSKMNVHCFDNHPQKWQYYRSNDLGTNWRWNSGEISGWPSPTYKLFETNQLVSELKYTSQLEYWKGEARPEGPWLVRLRIYTALLVFLWQSQVSDYYSSTKQNKHKTF